MVKIDVKCNDGYDAKVYEKGDTLRYYLRGPNGASNPRGEIGMIDLRGRFAGKFKAADNLPSGIGYGLVEEGKSIITLTTPDGKNLFIGQKAGPMDTQARITLGMCLNNATNLTAAQMDSENAPQNMVTTIFDLADELYAEYNKRYNA